MMDLRKYFLQSFDEVEQWKIKEIKRFTFGPG